VSKPMVANVTEPPAMASTNPREPVIDAA
jgi:hypothetical protein